jgi:IBR domain, a half RING-finger domain
MKTPCNHEYCGDCLEDLFETSLKDETLFPPRCCRQTIPVNSDELALFVKKPIRDKYATRKIEVETVDRTYCSNADCAEFILPSTIVDKTAACAKCSSVTCSGCKRIAHPGPCPEDSTEEQTLELARNEGWRRCSTCNRMIELDTGCYHMT